MSRIRIVMHAILAILVLIGAYMYFWALDFLNTNLGVNLSQVVNDDLSTWQFTVWMMSIMLAWIIVFIGVAKDHPNLEPIASACFLAFTIVSYFIGCSIFTLNFPFTGFGSLDVQISIDPSKLKGLIGGGGGGSPTIPVITINIGLIQLLVTPMVTVYAVLLFLRTLLKSRREPETSSTSSKPSKPEISYTPLSAKGDSTMAESKDFMKNVRKD